MPDPEKFGFVLLDPDSHRAWVHVAEGETYWRDAVCRWMTDGYTPPSADDLATNFAMLSSAEAHALIAHARAAMARPRHSLRTLVMGQALQKLGELYNEPETVEEGLRMEADATAAIKAGFADITEHKKQQAGRRRARNLPRA